MEQKLSSILEQKLERRLLYLPYRDHICEITLHAGIESKMGNTSEVNIPLFVRNKNDENSLNNFKAGIDDPNVHMHNARWMSKAIYVLKLFILREEFKLTAQEQKNLRDICICVVRFYVKIWFHCTKAAKAAKLDLNYLRDIYLYKTHDEKLAMAVLNEICGKLWYLSDQSIAFSFFDKNVSSAEKSRMVQQLDMKRDVEAESSKRVELKIDDVKTFITKQLADFVTPNTGDFLNGSRYPQIS